MEKNKIHDLRKQKKISQSLFGDLLGVSQQTVSKIESQPIPDISSELLARIADYFGVTLDYLMDRCGETGSDLFETDFKEIGDCLAPDDKRLWYEMGVRLAGNEFLAKRRKKVD